MGQKNFKNDKIACFLLKFEIFFEKVEIKIVNFVRQH